MNIIIEMLGRKIIFSFIDRRDIKLNRKVRLIVIGF